MTKKSILVNPPNNNLLPLGQYRRVYGRPGSGRDNFREGGSDIRLFQRSGISDPDGISVYQVVGHEYGVEFDQC